MKKYLIMTQVIFVAVCIAIAVVNSVQGDSPAVLGVLGVVGIIVGIIQVCIRRRMKRNEQDKSELERNGG